VSHFHYLLSILARRDFWDVLSPKTGVGLVNEFIENFQIVTKSNYNAIANSHTQHLTAARTSAVSSPVVAG
jgi:hypothetical protein